MSATARIRIDGVRAHQPTREGGDWQLPSFTCCCLAGVIGQARSAAAKERELEGTQVESVRSAGTTAESKATMQKVDHRQPIGPAIFPGPDFVAKPARPWTETPSVGGLSGGEQSQTEAVMRFGFACKADMVRHGGRAAVVCMPLPVWVPLAAVNRSACGTVVVVSGVRRSSTKQTRRLNASLGLAIISCDESYRSLPPRRRARAE